MLFQILLPKNYYMRKFLRIQITLIIVLVFLTPTANSNATTDFYKVKSFDKENNLSASDCIKDINIKLDSSSIEKQTISSMSKKTIRILIFLVDFPDYQKSKKETLNFTEMKNKISDFYEANSSDRLGFSWIQSTTYTRLSNTLESYRTGNRQSIGSILNIIRDAQDLAFKKFQKAFFDFIIVVPPSHITKKEISTSVAFLSEDEHYIDGTVLAGDYWQSGRSWTIPAHEIGHALGLVDLYSKVDTNGSVNNDSNYINQFNFMRFFDLMNWPTGPAPELLAWNRLLLGFLRETEFKCLPRGITNSWIAPIESSKILNKALIIKIQDDRWILVEYRTSTRFDEYLPKKANGVIVYEVDMQAELGNGQIKLISSNRRSSNPFYGSILKTGDYFEYQGILIEILQLVDGMAQIRVHLN